MKQLILFDIDGTLLHPGTLARRLMNDVVADVAGRSPDLRFKDVAGFTDPSIIRRALQKLRFNSGNLAPVVNEILDEYLIRLKKEYPSYETPHLYEDALGLVQGCKEMGWRVGLLTGNLRAGAEIKLERFNIWDKFDFGVFGDDAANREDLLWMVPELAWEKLGEAYTFDRMILVGDTPNDARIARMNGVRCLIVRRHAKWGSEIKEHQPTWLVESFEHVNQIIDWLSAGYRNKK